jgi:Arc/MetJ-type ribon-helix-helix transcriptional regulator
MPKQKGGTGESRAHTPGDSRDGSPNSDSNPAQLAGEHRRTVKSSAKTGTVSRAAARAAVKAVAKKRSQPPSTHPHGTTSTSKSEIVLTLDAALVSEIDSLVRQNRFANRSQVIEAAVSEQLVRLRRSRFAEACSLLDPDEERALAEEGLAADLVSWPEY